jgi:outer membrane protein assembly factor BamB/tetratricopeptide (TPR) repeat protein
VQQNRLRALDLATGEVRWEVGGPSPVRPAQPAPRPAPRAPRTAGTNLGDRAAASRRGALQPDPLADAYFLGPPLPLGGDLFVLIDKQQDLSLVCLDAERGAVRWTQSLAAAGDRIGVNVQRRTHAAHLAYGDGVLVCPTHSGAVLGVDPLTRGLLWAHVYREATSGENEAAAAVPTAWKGSTPVVCDGRVVFTAPDCDAVVCLRLRDGAPLWKVLGTEDDLFVAGVFGDKVLVVGRTACRALSLANGQSIWQRATGMPAGQGVAAGGSSSRGSAPLHPGLYYLPLADGAVLALDVEDPRGAVRIEPRPGAPREAAGNLVFYRGTLWSQGTLQLTAYLPLDDRLARVEQRLAAAPEDGAALAERGRLRLERGDLAGAAADLHAALQHTPGAEERADTGGRLHAALGLLLQRDFGAGEKYLDEYRRLGTLVPSGGRPPDDETRHQRRLQLRALVARGRESQGRVAEALREYGDLLDGARPDNLLAVPEDPALRVRPDVWVRGRVAALAGHARGSRVLNAEIERRWQEVLTASHPDEVPDGRLARFLALFGEIADGPGAAAAREARMRWARDCARAPYRPRAIDADLLLWAVEKEEGAPGPNLAARALEARARLLTRQGLLEEAAACYRRLGTAFARVEIEEGRTGADALVEAALDKRLLSVGDVTRPPPAVRWPDGRMKVVELPGRGSSDMLVVPAVPRQPWGPASPGTLGTGTPSAFVRGLRFFLDGRSLQLLAVDRNTGAPRFSIPLPLANFPVYLRANELPCQAVDHLLILAAGPTLLGIDLLERRVRWSRNMLDEASARGLVLGILPDGTFNVNPADGQPMRQMGWVGPAGSEGVYIHNRAGLTCLDAASGEVRWVRSDVPTQLRVSGDGERLYLAEHNGAEGIRGVRAVRVADGTAVAIPGATAAYSHRVRVAGRRLLVSEEGPNREVRLRLYDLPTGKDVWAREFPAGSVLLSAPLAEWAGMAAPDGAVTVVDLEAGRETLRLALDRRHLEKVTGGQLFADADQVYVALQGPGDGVTKILDGPNPFFRAGLASAPVNGMLYAFDRSRGGLRWFSATPAQSILLERFDELPLLLCAATCTRQGTGPGEAVGYVAFRSIDKRTGKVVCNRENLQVGEPFHTLQIDARAGTVDLIGPALVLRHQVSRKP